jgi:hypothetical protein
MSDNLITTPVLTSSPVEITGTHPPIPSPSGTEHDATTPTALLSCILPNIGEELQILHDDRIFWTDMDLELILQVEERLEETHPEFYRIQQSVYYSDLDKTSHYEDAFTITWQASGIEIDYVNPLIVLVTVGENLNWKPPAEGNLYQQARDTRLALLQHYRKFRDNKNIQAQNRLISDPSSYMIYIYYNADMEKISQWCESYYELVGQYPITSPSDE